MYIQKFKLSKFELPSFLIRYVRIDVAFTDKEKALIAQALIEWENKTSKLVAFDIVNLEANEIYDSNRNAPDEVKNEEYYEVITFIRAESHSNIIKMAEEKHNRKAYGYAHWGDFLFIAMVADRIPDDQTFKAVAMHEVGHLLGMDHLKHKKTLMYKYTNKKIKTLTKQDLIYFLKRYDYSVSNKPADILKKLTTL